MQVGTESANVLLGVWREVTFWNLNSHLLLCLFYFEFSINWKHGSPMKRRDQSSIVWLRFRYLIENCVYIFLENFVVKQYWRNWLQWESLTKAQIRGLGIRGAEWLRISVRRSWCLCCCFVHVNMQQRCTVPQHSEASGRCPAWNGWCLRVMEVILRTCIYNVRCTIWEMRQPKPDLFIAVHTVQSLRF